MKLTINHYIKRLFKENLIYIFVIIAVVALFIYITTSWTSEYLTFRNKIQATETEITALSQRKTRLDKLIVYNLPEIKEFNVLLARLVPESEDYFSIIYALDKLSTDTNFIISDYVLNLGESTSNKLSVSVRGNGDSSAFSKFLDDYNFVSGRLITMSNFDFNKQGIQYAFNFNFYSSQILKDISQIKSIPENNIQFMRKVKNKTGDILIKEPSQNLNITDYAVSSDPF